MNKLIKYEELINCCLDIIKAFNPIIETVDSHAENFLKKYDNPNERVFIKQVFYGTYRYEEFLKAFNTAIFTALPAKTNRNDSTLFQIFVYLSVFRLSELPLEEYKKLVLAQNPVKINVLLNFLFDYDQLVQHAKPLWLNIYDEHYIDETVIGGLQQNLPHIADLLANISEKATGKKSELASSMRSESSDEETKIKKKKEPTRIEAFNLTKPKPKQLPEPIVIPKIVKSNPVPKSIYKKDLKTIEEEKKKRREEKIQEAQKNLEEEKQKAFNFETEKRPTKFQKIKEEIEKLREEETKIKSYYKKAPNFDNEQNDIKLNVAAILREDALIQKKRQEEEKIIKDLEINMRDASEYEKWKEDEKSKLKMQELENQQRKKIEMELAREAAMQAYEDKKEINKFEADKLKELSKEQKYQLELKLKEELEKKKKVVEETVESRANVEAERLKLIEKNKKIHDELENEIQDAFQRKKLEEEEERKKRQELIRQIRELDRQPKKRTKGYDPTETPGLGLLEEMSLIELREKLEKMKLERAEEIEKKRMENTNKKEEKINSIKGKLKDIQEVRADRASEYHRKKSAQKKQIEEEEKKKNEIREKNLKIVTEKLTQKKQKQLEEKLRLAKDYKEFKLKKQYLNANQAMVEEKAWKSLEDGAEREIKSRQNNKLIDQEKHESIKMKERTILAKVARGEILDKIDYLQEYDERLEKANKENEILFREEREQKERLHDIQKNFEISQKQNNFERDPYKTKISDINVASARTYNQSKNLKKYASSSGFDLPEPKYDDGIAEEDHDDLNGEESN